MGERKHNHEKGIGRDPQFSIIHSIKRELNVERAKTLTFLGTD